MLEMENKYLVMIATVFPGFLSSFMIQTHTVLLLVFLRIKITKSTYLTTACPLFSSHSGRVVHDILRLPEDGGGWRHHAGHHAPRAVLRHQGRQAVHQVLLLRTGRLA